MTGEPDRLRAALVVLTRGEALPEIQTIGLRRARIRSQGVDGRVSLQMVDRSEDDPDTLPVPVWMGVPGVSADHTPGQELALAFSRADAADPVAFLAAPRGQPGHVPIRVRHEATTEIRFVSASPGTVKIGPGITLPVAMAAAVQSILAALTTFATTASSATTAPQIAAAATTLLNALGAVADVAATRLEAV